MKLNFTDHESFVTRVALLPTTLVKLGGRMFPARLTGMSWNDPFALSVLMNKRHLAELAALNFGCDLGILPLRVLVRMVTIALVTTIFDWALLNLPEGRQRDTTAAITETIEPLATAFLAKRGGFLLTERASEPGRL